MTRLITDIDSVLASGPYAGSRLGDLADPVVLWLVAPYFDRARRAGYPAVAHAREAAGAALGP